MSIPEHVVELDAAAAAVALEPMDGAVAVRALFRDGYALGASAILSAGLGFVSWIVAARLHPQDEVGRAAGLLQAMMLLSALGLANQTAALLRFLPSGGADRRRLMGDAYAIASTATALFAVGYVVAGPTSLLGGEGAVALAGFVVATIAWTVFTMQDASLAGLGLATVVPTENVGFGVARLALLVALAGTSGPWAILWSWVLPVVVLIAVVHLGPVARRLRVPAVGLGAPRSDVQRYAAATWFPTMLQHAVQLATPLVVIAAVGTELGAAFSMAWLITSNLELVAIGFGNALLVQAARDQTALPALVAAALRRQAVVLVPGLLAIAALADPILSVFGREYAEDGAGSLRLLALAMVPRVFSLTVSSAARVAGRLRVLVALQLPITVGTIGLAAVLAPAHGIEAAAWGSVVAHVVVAAAAVPVWRDLRGER